MATKPLTLVLPMDVSPAKLVSSNVAETDYPAYAAGTTYALDARVISLTTHVVYQSLQAGNIGHDPTVDANIGVWWQEVSVTNRYKMFDTEASTVTTNVEVIDVTIQPDQVINALGFIGMAEVNTVRVIMTDPVDGVVHDTTYDMRGSIPESTWYSYLFSNVLRVTDFVVTDLPTYGSASVRLIFTGGAGITIGVSTCIIGAQTQIGLGVHYQARLSIQDYSRQETNAYGDLVLVRRNYAQRATFEMWITKAETDSVYRRISSLRSTPILWIGTEEYESTILLGIFKDFEITLAYPDTNICSMQLLGLARL